VSQPQQLPQLALLERIVAALRADSRLRAAFLRGSFHYGRPDVYSDLDVFAVVADSAAAALATIGRELLEAAGEVAWISVLNTPQTRLRALFPGPVQVDLSMIIAQDLPPYDGWRILLDDDQLLRARSRPAPALAPLLPEHVSMICDEFWWSLFSSVGQLKRGRLWMALHLLDTCRAGLAQMMRWRRDHERPSERFGDLERHLTAEDQQALAQTLASYDARHIARALLCAADAFEPAAREVAARTGAPYPAALAHTIKEFFLREFWSLIAPGPTISA
jgi:hypothetical protein